jgi:hypothetical protein
MLTQMVYDTDQGYCASHGLVNAARLFRQT